jgi:hypothetical protein
MRITVDLPDDLASRPDGQMEALEAFVVEGLREGALNKVQGMKLMERHRFEFDGFVEKHQIERFAYNEQDLECDLRTIEGLREKGMLRA